MITFLLILTRVVAVICVAVAMDRYGIGAALLVVVASWAGVLFGALPSKWSS